MPKFVMHPMIANINMATVRTRNSLECTINSLMKYNNAVAQASDTLTSDLRKCKALLDEYEPLNQEEEK